MLNSSVKKELEDDGAHGCCPTALLGTLSKQPAHAYVQ